MLRNGSGTCRLVLWCPEFLGCRGHERAYRAHSTFQHVSPDGGLINIIPFPHKLPVYQHARGCHAVFCSTSSSCQTVCMCKTTEPAVRSPQRDSVWSGGEGRCTHETCRKETKKRETAKKARRRQAKTTKQAHHASPSPPPRVVPEPTQSATTKTSTPCHPQSSAHHLEYTVQKQLNKHAIPAPVLRQAR